MYLISRPQIGIKALHACSVRRAVSQARKLSPQCPPLRRVCFILLVHPFREVSHPLYWSNGYRAQIDAPATPVGQSCPCHFASQPVIKRCRSTVLVVRAPSVGRSTCNARRTHANELSSFRSLYKPCCSCHAASLASGTSNACVCRPPTNTCSIIRLLGLLLKLPLLVSSIKRSCTLVRNMPVVRRLTERRSSRRREYCGGYNIYYTEQKKSEARTLSER